ncbi:MAG: hypothetical protein IKY79_06585 [Bacteroidales bacterium]|nr:hypothetical protein [Bacteroidales bacterium]
MTNNQNIDKLLAKFYDASISQEEIDILFDYFLYTDPLPECYSADVELIRGLAIMRYCHKTKRSFEKSLIEKERKTRNAFAYKMVKYGVAFAACVAAVVVGLWQLRINSVLIPNTPEALQSSTTILAAQTTDMPATITDNEIKNTADHTTNKYNHTRYAENEPATPQPDIIATAPIEQEHIPVLLAETETQIEIEQNLVAEENNDNISTSPVYTSELLAFDNTDINNIDNEQYWQLAEFDTFCNTRCTDMQVVETITRTLI